MTDEIELRTGDMRDIPELGLLQLRLDDIQGVVLLEAPSSRCRAVTFMTDYHISRMAPYAAALRKAADWIEKVVAQDAPPAGTRCNAIGPTPKLAALSHGTITNDPCALCGARTDPCGFDPVVAGTVALVCDDCCMRDAPELWQAIHAGRDYGQMLSPSPTADLDDLLPF